MDIVVQPCTGTEQVNGRPRPPCVLCIHRTAPTPRAQPLRPATVRSPFGWVCQNQLLELPASEPGA